MATNKDTYIFNGRQTRGNYSEIKNPLSVLLIVILISFSIIYIDFMLFN